MKLKKMEVNFYGLLVLFFLLIAALASRPGLAAAEEEKILKWGTIEPLSGPAALWGKAMNQGVELAVDEFNAEGGLKVGNTRYKIKILEEDDKYTGAGGVAAASRLIYQEGVKFITGSLLTGVVFAIQPITEKEKCLIMTLASGDTCGKDKPFTFRIGYSALSGIAGSFKAVAEKYPGRVKRIAYISTNDQTGWDTAKVVKAVGSSKALGWEVVTTEYYERGTTDFHPCWQG